MTYNTLSLIFMPFVPDTFNSFPNGIVTQVSSSEDQVQFYCVEEGINQIHVYCTVGNIQVDEYVAFDVAKPTFANNGTSYGTIGVYGDFLKSGNPASHDGIESSVTAAKPSGVSTGSVAFIQVVHEWEQRTDLNNATESMKIPGWWQDGIGTYDGEYSLTTTRGMSFHDTPKFLLENNYKKYQVHYQNFTMFLMYKSSIEGSIWVPVAKMDWDWYAQADSSDGGNNWSYTSGGHTITSPQFMDTTIFPVYTGVATSENPEWEED